MSDNTKEIAKMLYHIADCLMVYERFVSLKDCNTCGKQKSCEYCPSPGEQTRINCPLWKESSNGQVKQKG